MSRRATILRVARRAAKLARYGWEVWTPLFIAVSGLLLTHVTDTDILGAAMIAWAVDLAYQRGKVTEGRRIGSVIFAMVCEERSIDITVTHEHRTVSASTGEAQS